MRSSTGREDKGGGDACLFVGIRPALRRGHAAARSATGVRLARADRRLDGTARALLVRRSSGWSALRLGFRASATRSRGIETAPRWRPIFGLRAVAAFEALKGVIVLVAGFGLAKLIHGDVQQAVEDLVERLHLDPAKKYPRIFLDLAGNLSDGQLWALAALAMVYATLRFAEAYGLWFARRWGEWVAALSGGIYVPVEIYELSRGFSVLKLGALILNAVVVAYMCHLLLRREVVRP